MKQVKHHLCFFASILLLSLIGCNQSESTSVKSDRDTTAVASTQTSSMPAYDPAMDPLVVGAAFSTKLGDTLNMKLFEVTLKPGDSIALHTHPDHSFYVIEGGKIEVMFKEMGKKIFDLKPGMGWIGGPVTDFGKNIGTTTVKWVETDVYRPRVKG